MAEEQEQEIIGTFFDNNEERHVYETALAEVEPDLEEIEAEFDDCQRLSEDDFVVRINARD